MAIRIECGCGKAFDVPEASAGKRGRCKACGATFTVPASEVGFELKPTFGPRARLYLVLATLVGLSGVVAAGFVIWPRQATETKPIAVAADKPNVVAEPPKAVVPKAYDWSRLLSVRTLDGPHGVPKCMAFSPDGRYLAIGTDTGNEEQKLKSGEIRIWDVIANKPITIIVDDESGISGMAFSPDFKTFVSCGTGPGKAYDTSNWSPRFRLDTAREEKVRFTADSRSIFCGAPSTVWDAATGIKQVIPGLRLLEYWALSPAGNLLEMDEDGKGCAIYEYPSRRKLGEFPDFMVYARDFSPDGKTLVSFDQTKLKSWDISTPSHIRMMAEASNAGENYTTLSISSDGQAMASVDLQHGGVIMRSVPELTIIKRLPGPPGVVACEFQPHGDMLAVLTETNQIVIARAAERK